jgi:hypothetical protein
MDCHCQSPIESIFKLKYQMIFYPIYLDATYSFLVINALLPLVYLNPKYAIELSILPEGLTKSLEIKLLSGLTPDISVRVFDLTKKMN